EHGVERLGRTGNRCRTERGHAVTRQTCGDLRNCFCAVERIVPFDAMDMHVDETGHDETFARVDDGSGGRCTRSGLDGHDAVAVDQKRCVGQDAVRQDDVAAGEDDHRAIMAARAAPSGPASSPSAAAATVSESAMLLGRRRSASVCDGWSSWSAASAMRPPRITMFGSVTATRLATAMPT